MTTGSANGLIQDIFVNSIPTNVAIGGSIKIGSGNVVSESDVEFLQVLNVFDQASQMAKDQGISYEGDILDLAVKGEIVQKMGSWFSYNDVKIGQGRENAKQFFIDNNDVREEIITHVKSFMGLEESMTEGNGKS